MKVAIVCFEIAVVEDTVRIDCVMDDDEGQMTRGLEDVDVHEGS